MDDHPEQPHNTFVVRFWREWRGGDAEQTPGWRGRIEHVQSGENMAFRDTRQLLAFIGRFVSPLSSPPSDGEPAGGEDENLRPGER